MKQVEEYFLYDLYSKYNKICHNIANLKQDENFLEIINQLKINLKIIFKAHKVMVNTKEWEHFDNNLTFTKNFWDKFILNKSAKEDYDSLMADTITVIDNYKQSLWDTKNKLRLDMWAHTNTIPVDLLIGDKLVPIYYYPYTKVKAYQDDAIELAQHLYDIGFNVKITKCVGNISNGYKPEYTYMVWANIKPEYADLLLTAWPLGTIDNEVPHWSFPMSVNQDWLLEYSQLPNTIYDDYNPEGDK